MGLNACSDTFLGKFVKISKLQLPQIQMEEMATTPEGGKRVKQANAPPVPRAGPGLEEILKS